MEKRALRKKIKEKSEGLSLSQKNGASEKITELFLACEEYKAAENIFIYVSTPNEPDTDEIIKRALKDNKNVFVPKCISRGNMLAVRITDLTVLSPGYMGIREPEGISGEESIKIDTAVIPCISAYFDGKRLGHGAGFYDIFLEKHKPKKICLCFSELISEEIPMEDHDIYMDAVITQKGIFRL